MRGRSDVPLQAVGAAAYSRSAVSWMSRCLFWGPSPGATPLPDVAGASAAGTQDPGGGSGAGGGIQCPGGGSGAREVPILVSAGVDLDEDVASECAAHCPGGGRGRKTVGRLGGGEAASSTRLVLTSFLKVSLIGCPSVADGGALVKIVAGGAAAGRLGKSGGVAVAPEVKTGAREIGGAVGCAEGASFSASPVPLDSGLARGRCP